MKKRLMFLRIRDCSSRAGSLYRRIALMAFGARKVSSLLGVCAYKMHRVSMNHCAWVRFVVSNTRNHPEPHHPTGSGSKLYDELGREYVDWAAGIAVNALGHSDPGLAAVVAAQMQKVQHLSNLYHSWEPLHLAQALVESTKSFDKAFLCNSGTEANEAALKFAKKVALVRAQASAQVMRGGDPSASTPATSFTTYACKGVAPETCFTRGGVCGCWPQATSNSVAAGLRTGVLAFKGAFHGRSMGSLAATHKPTIRQPFAPLPADAYFARYNNIEDVDRVLSSGLINVAIVEPVMGEHGVIPADRGESNGGLGHVVPTAHTPVPQSTARRHRYPICCAAFLRHLRDATAKAGVLLIVDEVQCGLGRSGRLWAHEAYDVAPDMMTLAKPLAGGMPIGAVLVTDAVAGAVLPGEHGTTFGGNPLVAAAALHAFSRISKPEFLAATRARGAQLVAGARALAAKYPTLIKEVRAPLDGGLFVGIELTVAPKPLVRAALDEGLLIITGGETSLRICPPLVVTEAEVDFGLRVLNHTIPVVFADHLRGGA